MFKLLISTLLAVCFLYGTSFAQKTESKAPPKDIATQESSAYTPEDKPKDKLDKDVRVTGPVWINPLDEDKEKDKEDLEKSSENEEIDGFESEESEDLETKELKE